jgi:glycosyltransferase involved in cell wall biosynthesis
MGIKQAKGDFIIFLDADDLFSDRCIEYRVKKAKGTSAAAIFANIALRCSDVRFSFRPELRWRMGRP